MPISIRATNALANWVANPENPLTARVMVNRIWFHHFGQAIVDTPSDFGAMGGRPTHPELLDWLASEFVRSGWDVKHMHKLIVMSNAYRQSSRFNEASNAEDPRNKLLWRFPRQRLEISTSATTIFDSLGAKDESCGGRMEYAIRIFFFDTAAPSLILTPNFTGFEPGSLLRYQSSLSRVRLVRISSK